MASFPDQPDRTGALIAQRRETTPGVPLDGMEILSRAQRLVRLSRQWIDPVFARHGIDAGEFDVLATLSRGGPPFCQRPTELFQSLMITSGGLTDRLSRLMAKGLIERIVDEHDRRSALVQLTSDGLSLINVTFEEDMVIEAELVSSLPYEDRHQLATLLARLLAVLEGQTTTGRPDDQRGRSR